MKKRLIIISGVVLTVALMVLSLWLWQEAASIAARLPLRRELGASAVHSGTIALMAGAQIVLLVLVVDMLWRRDIFSDILKLSASTICLVATLTAMVLGLAGR